MKAKPYTGLGAAVPLRVAKRVVPQGFCVCKALSLSFEGDRAVIFYKEPIVGAVINRPFWVRKETDRHAIDNRPHRVRASPP